MHIIRDNREQRGFSFAAFPEVTVEDGTLLSGDYSLKGLESRIAIERKSLDDLIMSISRDRDRFCRELDRAKGLESFVILCEGRWSDLVHGRYKSKMNPASAVSTVAAIMARRGVPVFFAESREQAEQFVVKLLRMYLTGKEREAQAIQQALTDNGTGSKMLS